MRVQSSGWCGESAQQRLGFFCFASNHACLCYYVCLPLPCPTEPEPPVLTVASSTVLKGLPLPFPTEPEPPVLTVASSTVLKGLPLPCPTEPEPPVLTVASSTVLKAYIPIDYETGKL
ncbi:hypothetical protein PGTUg99_018212 [Puccinia graminis f. sp. tritici]|uniref:Uncharacterized protein n=1 Tax=Puccinia graminis f. sp. tritici TaxID=56615 RepID=A0A5B0QLI1_PUCGR|nr:hypothetical protein PGTUg99_018212 [Puccinia graminis f. sp. tritici]